MIINNNPTATAAYNSLNKAAEAQGKSIEKLSSGLRINRSADDAAGLVMSEKLRTQVNGTSVAIRNAQDGISIMQTADGGLNEISAILQRGRDLAVQASNANHATNGADADAVAAAAAEWDQLSAEIDRIVGSTTFGSDTTGGTKTALLDGSYTADFTIGWSADSTAGDVATVDLSSYGAVDSTTLGVASGAITGDAGDVAAFDAAINSVSTLRGAVGAYQNRFEHAVSNMQNMLENYTAAESRIRDTDMAAEMTKLTKSQILSQASTAMLAQANQAPQGVLQLLR